MALFVLGAFKSTFSEVSWIRGGIEFEMTMLKIGIQPVGIVSVAQQFKAGSRIFEEESDSSPAIHALILKGFRTAKAHVYIEDQYANLVTDYRTEIERALMRGVRFVVLTNDAENTNVKAV